MITLKREDLLELVGDRQVTAAELCEGHDLIVAFPAVCQSLDSLHREGRLTRRWRSHGPHWGWEYRQPERASS
jgi:hypothetical protein